MVPIDRWSKVAQRAVRLAVTLSPDIARCISIPGTRRVTLRHQWEGYVEEPAVKAGLVAPKLTVVESPYRFVINPIVDFVLDLERRNPDRQIAVLIPEMIERRWYFHPLHNQRAAALKTLLYFKGSHRIIVINLPW